MEYRVDIIDSVDDSHVISFERAVRESLVLEWQGADTIDELGIMPSSFDLTMISMVNNDAYYYDLFTGDETRYKVRLYQSDGRTIWTGFLLPDLFSEPYESAPIVSKFKATDGLGRLKGKFLPDDYYKEEKSVIDIISTCLRLTGLELELYYSPAIENSLNKDYGTIYLYGELFKSDSDKKEDAYSILEKIINSELCVIRQVNARWNVEGFNVINFRVYDAKVYDFNGNFINEVTVTRNYKSLNQNGIVTNISSQEIDIIPPYGHISVNHEREDILLPETLYEEVNDGWANIRRFETFIYSTDWIGRNGFNAKAYFYDEYQVSFPSGDTANDYISLRYRPYLRQGEKYQLKMSFKVGGLYNDDAAQQEIENGNWVNPFLINVVKVDENETTNIYTNLDTAIGYKKIDVSFDDQGEFEDIYEFIVNEDGLFDIQLFAIEYKNIFMNRILIQEISLEQIDFKENYTAQSFSNRDFTLKKELDLDFADDYSGYSPSFRLQKLLANNNYEEFEVNVDRNFFKDDFYYYAIPINHANLIKENIDEVYLNGNKYEITDLIYNIFDSEEHVIKNETQITGSITVRVYDYNAVTEDRTYWERWSDSLYKVEQLRYADAALNVLLRLSNKERFRSKDVNSNNNIKISDFVGQKYKGVKDWCLSSCRWNVDSGRSDITMIEAYYSVTPGDNIPPVVEAGDDIYYTDDDRQATLVAEAYDPDGFIVSYFWEIIQGSGGVILNPNESNTGIIDLSDDYYEIRVTVTDNDGATSSDTVELFLRDEHELVLTESNINSGKAYEVSFNPLIPDGAIVNIRGNFLLSIIADDNRDPSIVQFNVLSDGQYVRNIEISAGGISGTDNADYEDDFSITYYNGISLSLELIILENFDRELDTDLQISAEFTIDEIQFVSGGGTITNLPESRSISFSP